MRLIFTVLITVLLWTGTAWADWIAVMDATADNRLAKYAKFETESEAQAHVDKFIGTYPDAFVHERIQGELEHWKVDIVNETLTFEPDSTELDKEVHKDIESHARGLISDFMDSMDFETGAALHLLFIRANGQAWTQAEQDFADGLAVKFEYIRDVYVTAKNAIQGISGMTEQEKLDFNASTDIVWPIAP